MTELLKREVALPIPGELSLTGLKLPEDLPFDEWERIGAILQRMERSAQWWLGDWLRFGERQYGEMYSQALEATDYEYSTLANMKWVAEHIPFSERSENLSWSHHQQVASLQPRLAAELIGRAEEEGLSVRQLQEEVKWAKYVAQRPQPPAPGDVPLIGIGRFDLIYADPPWQYDFRESSSRAIANHYPTMSLPEICELPVGEIAAPDCLLFLWATAPKLYEAMRVIGAWGFEYRTQMVWVKDRIGMGKRCRNQHENLLIAMRGSVPMPKEADRPSSVIMAPRSVHSRKPHEVYELLERMYPQLRKVELFARNTRPGWHSWGLEVSSPDTYFAESG